MSRLIRLSILTVLAMTLNADLAHADAFNVAEFSWDLQTLDPGIDCSTGEPGCEPIDPFVVSFFSLTNIWDGPGTITLFDSELILPTGSLQFDDPFSLYLIEGSPSFASTEVSFVFEGETISLAATLTRPDTISLQFDPTTVPEPGTLGLLALGTGLVTLRRRRRR